MPPRVDQCLFSTDARHGDMNTVHQCTLHSPKYLLHLSSLLPLRTSEKGNLSILIHGLMLVGASRQTFSKLIGLTAEYSHQKKPIIFFCGLDHAGTTLEEYTYVVRIK